MRNLLKALLRWLAGRLYRITVEGDLPATGRMLIVANHQSYLDGLLLGLFLPREPVFVISTEVAGRPLVRRLLSVVDHLTVAPDNPIAMKQIVRLVESGRPVVIFPEGRITLTGSLMKIYDGPGFVADRAGAAIVPIWLDGPALSPLGRLARPHPLRWFPRVTISILPPVRLELSATLGGRARRTAAGEALRRILQQAQVAATPLRPLPAAFLAAVRQFGRGRPALEDIQGDYSYGKLLKMALALSRIAARHTRAGENVGVLLPNVATTVGLLLGLMMGRRVPTLLNYTAGAEGLVNACRVAAVRVVLTSRAFVEGAALQAEVAALKEVTVLYLEDLRQGFGWRDKLWLLLIALPAPQRVPGPMALDHPAVVLFTSGSEGRPKGVVLSHRAIAANIVQIRATVPFSPADKFLSALPVFHSFGLTAGVFLPLLNGVPFYLFTSPLKYKLIPELAYEKQCTVLFGTSTFLGQYARNAHPMDFQSMRYVVAGAEKLSDSVRDLWMEKFGIRVLEGYGVTETAPVIAVNAPAAYRRGTVGLPMPGLDLRLVPVPGIVEGGQLHVRGPNVMLGYYRPENPGYLDLTASALGPGWHDTGDIVRIDEAGYLAIVGRVKRFAKIAGEMVSLEAVERIAAAASPDFQHAAVAVPHPGKGEAVIVISTDPALSRDRLRAAARDLGLPDLAVPRQIRWQEALPLLGTGKTDYVTLGRQALVAAGEEAVAGAGDDADPDYDA